MQRIFNHCVQNGLFPDLLKPADATSLHQMDDKTRKKSYIPVSVLLTVSKVFERLQNYMDYLLLIAELIH